MNICPCCGQSIDISDVLLSLETNTISRAGRMVSLAPMEAEIMALMLKRYPNRVTMNQIWHAIYGHAEGPATNMSLRTTICWLRRMIWQLGLEIGSYYSHRTRYNGGYRLIIKSDIPPINGQGSQAQAQGKRANRQGPTRLQIGDRPGKSGTRL